MLTGARFAPQRTAEIGREKGAQLLFGILGRRLIAFGSVPAC
jgi:hypothetical protein